MLYIEEDELEPVMISERRRCSVCKDRKHSAAWRVEPRNGGDKVLMCSWCILYSGASKWGHENREELSAMGVLCKVTAERTRGQNTHVPKLDARHRLDKKGSDRLLLGVQFTSRALRNKLGPVVKVHLKSESQQ